MDLPYTLVNALYESLLTPTKDQDGRVIYTIALTLAADLRMAIKQEQAKNLPQ
jgi:hypothetical protein